MTHPHIRKLHENMAARKKMVDITRELAAEIEAQRLTDAQQAAEQARQQQNIRQADGRG